VFGQALRPERGHPDRQQLVTFDANRNATGISWNNYGYDAANRLNSTSAGSGATTYAFDPNGRLYQFSAGGLPTRFQYTGQA